MNPANNRDVRLAACRPMHRWIKPSIRRLWPDGIGLDVLDCGCGTGHMADWICSMGHEVVGFDISASKISRARRAFSMPRFEVAAVDDDLSSLAPECGFDVILSTDVIEHLYSPQSFLRNMHPHLKPGGVLLLTTPYHGYFKNLALSLLDGWDQHLRACSEQGHIKFFSQRTLSRLLGDCGFCDPVFCNAGRLPYLWKTMVCRSIKPEP